VLVLVLVLLGLLGELDFVLLEAALWAVALAVGCLALALSAGSCPEASCT
jgi:hypothetical protein